MPVDGISDSDVMRLAVIKRDVKRGYAITMKDACVTFYGKLEEIWGN
jgi:hypothetical protein